VEAEEGDSPQIKTEITVVLVVVVGTLFLQRHPVQLGQETHQILHQAKEITVEPGVMQLLMPQEVEVALVPQEALELVVNQVLVEMAQHLLFQALL
jgi:hypothetical protein